MKNRASSFNGDPPCRYEVKFMSKKKGLKHARKKQWRSILPWIDKLAAALFWVVKTILLLVDWFNR